MAEQVRAGTPVQCFPGDSALQDPLPTIRLQCPGGGDAAHGPFHATLRAHPSVTGVLWGRGVPRAILQWLGTSQSISGGEGCRRGVAQRPTELESALESPPRVHRMGGAADLPRSGSAPRVLQLRGPASPPQGSPPCSTGAPSGSPHTPPSTEMAFPRAERGGGRHITPH